MKKETTDIVIIGAGPIGLFAVFACGMLKMKCHVIDSLEEVGGQCAALYPEKPIYDIPGYPHILAGELVEKLQAQAAPFKPAYHLNQTATDLQQKGERFEVTTSGGSIIDCAGVILAAGAGAFGPNRPPLENLEQYEGKSVFYMVRKRSAFAGKKVAIAGGGDSAVDWAISLADVAEKIYFIHRRDKFRAAPESVTQLEALAKAGKVEMVIPYQLSKLHGEDGSLKEIELADLEGKKKTIQADALLPFFGIVPNLGALNSWGLDIVNHHIPADPLTLETPRPGIHAVGDIATYPRKMKLILSGFHEATMAAHALRSRVFPGEELHFVYSTSMGVP